MVVDAFANIYTSRKSMFTLKSRASGSVQNSGQTRKVRLSHKWRHNVGLFCLRLVTLDQAAKTNDA